MEEILKQILKNQQDTQKTLQQQSSQYDYLQKGQTRLESRIDSLDSNQIKLETRIENEIIEKLRALYDARSVQNDVNTRIIDTLERIEAKIDILQMETAHVRKLKRNRSI